MFAAPPSSFPKRFILGARVHLSVHFPRPFFPRHFVSGAGPCSPHPHPPFQDVLFRGATLFLHAPCPSFLPERLMVRSEGGGKAGKDEGEKAGGKVSGGKKTRESERGKAPPRPRPPLPHLVRRKRPQGKTAARQNHARRGRKKADGGRQDAKEKAGCGNPPGLPQICATLSACPARYLLRRST